MNLTEIDIEDLRRKFPALENCHKGQPIAYFDGPAGTQVPQSVIHAMNRYLIDCNANKGASFAASQKSDRWMCQAQQAFADFIGVEDSDEVIFGQNMTSLTFALSRSLARTWSRGDEIIVTRLDHDANIAPWVMAAEDAGVTVHFVDFDPQNGYQLNLEQLASLLNSKTRLVAVGCASNATGGINPVAEICQLAHKYNALTFLDAVHYAPHRLLDVQAWGCDFLACSAYKFFGPHLGILWGKRELLESLPAYQVRPASKKIPGKWTTGTQSFESIAGGMACVDYLADEVGGRYQATDATRRDKLTAAFSAIQNYEDSLARHLLCGLKSIQELRIYGLQDEAQLSSRFATFSITHNAIPTPQLARILGEHGIYVWAGNYYALEFTEQLGLEPTGMVRVGALHYNTVEEIDRLLNVLDSAAC